jgi:hypothetical protein
MPNLRQLATIPQIPARRSTLTGRGQGLALIQYTATDDGIRSRVGEDYNHIIL